MLEATHITEMVIQVWHRPLDVAAAGFAAEMRTQWNLGSARVSAAGKPSTARPLTG
jgi:hypothetical protein